MGGFNADGLSFIATKLGDPKMLDSFTCAMCVNFARPLIELDVTILVYDELVVVIKYCLASSTVDNDGFQEVGNKRLNASKTIRNGNKSGGQPLKSKIRYEPKGVGNTSKNYYVLGNTSKPTNGSNRSVVKSESSIPVSISFSTLEEDNDNFMDDLVDDTRKNVEAPLRKTRIWSNWKAERNIGVSLEMELHYIDRDVLEFANMDEMMEVVEHGNVPSEHG
ncbi:hypothetical protein Tco_1275838 [Tanacetum coccineum]